MTTLLALRNGPRLLSQLQVSKYAVQRLSSALKEGHKTEDNDFIIKSSHRDVETVVGVTLPELVWSNLSKWESLPAFECGATGRKYKHGEIYELSRNFGAALLQSGLKRNDVVGIVLPNIPEYAIVLLGILEAGLIATPANPVYKADELRMQFNLSKAKCVVTASEFVPLIQSAREGSQTLRSIIAIGESIPEGAHSFAEMIKVNSKGVEFLTGTHGDMREQIAVIPFSSGTTGPPKGVVLTHSNLATNMLQQTCPTVTVLRRYDDGNEQDRIVGVLPFFHIYGLNVILTSTLFKGCYCVTLPRFEPSTFVKTFKIHRPTVIHMVTPLLNYMLNSRDITQAELEHIRAIIAGAAPVGSVLINNLLQKAGKYIFFQEGFGMTEASPVTHMLTTSTKNTKIGSVGQLLPSTLAKIVDVETGKTLPRNQEGELLVKGPQVMKGYLDNEKATQETINSDGWLHTGDIGYVDDDGCFYIVDRLKELIKVKGLQVAPSELENLLRELPGVADCAVIGIPSDSSGELPRAYIVKEDTSLTSDAVTGYIRKNVAPFKQLAGGVEFVDAIPKAASGKILRRELKRNYLESKGKK